MPTNSNSFVVILSGCKVKVKFSGFITTYCVMICIKCVTASSRPTFQTHFILLVNIWSKVLFQQVYKERVSKTHTS